jgi:hypothetical protein
MKILPNSLKPRILSIWLALIVPALTALALCKDPLQTQPPCLQLAEG